jgi:hypothetical protein
VDLGADHRSDRPELEPGRGLDRHAVSSQIRLDRSDFRTSEGGMPADVLNQLVDKADGVA